MARYCFYCGRELATGEKCNCRTHAPAATPGSSAGQSQTSGATGAAAGPSAGSSAGPRPQAQSTGETSRPGQASGRPTDAKHSKFDPSAWLRDIRDRVRSSAQPRRTASTKSQATLLGSLAKVLGFVARPVEMIRQAVLENNASRLLTQLLVHAGLGGLAAVVVDRSGTLDLILQLTIVSATGNAGLQSMFLFIQGAGLILVLDLMLILLTQLVLRYGFRASYNLIRVAASLTPVVFYSTLFLLMAMLSLSTSPFSSLMLLAGGLAVSTLALYLAVRQLTSFEENRCFLLVSLVLVLFTSLLAALFNLALPVLGVLVSQTLPL